MKLACCTWALGDPVPANLDQLADIGFAWIDIRSVDFRSESSRAQITERKLQLSCVDLSFALPADVGFDSPEPDAQTAAVAIAKDGVRHAAQLGASTAYVIPGTDKSRQALARYADALTKVADQAAILGIKLCIEHFPGRALPTVAETLAYLRTINHPNLYLLFDIGHAQMAGEEPTAALHAAADRLGYVHLDDNDGQNDLHWALTDGVLTQQVLHDTFSTLDTMNYTGGVSLELSPQLPAPLDAIQRSWKILGEVQRGAFVTKSPNHLIQ